MSKLIAFAFLAALPACTSTRLVPAEVGTFNSPKLKESVDHILVVPTPDTGHPTEVVAVLDVHEPSGNHDAALRTLKERAALLGADAVVGVEFHHEESGGGPHSIETHLSGVAVKMKPVFGDRPYSVLGEVTLDAPMGKEEQGLRDLQAKAGAMNADLLVDVHFFHDEAGKDAGTHFSGIAIKYR